MDTFYAEDEICLSCGFEGQHEISYEKLWGEDQKQIVHICPSCGRATLRGILYQDEEFYY